jgi:hypothetical protein
VDAQGKNETSQEKENKIDSPGETAAAQAEARLDISEPRHDISDQPQDVPVTMAVASEAVVAAASRWTAVSVALDAEEATISLDQEMQKAYAAFVPAEANSATVANIPNAQDSSSERPFAEPEPAVESRGAAISNPQPVPYPEPVTADTSAESESAPVAQPVVAATAASYVSIEPATVSEAASAVSYQPESASSPTASAEVTPVEAQVDAFGTMEFAEKHQDQNSTPEPVAEPRTHFRDMVIPAPQALESHPIPQPETANAGPGPESVQPKLDPETVKSTAAAWASWRQIRDTSKSGTVLPQTRESQSSEAQSSVSESAPEELSAKAVAAGAEQLLQETSVVAANEKPADVASIVDSVLADLRPKLMEEISRKMAEKK